jgi:hypothetical protein
MDVKKRNSGNHTDRRNRDGNHTDRRNRTGRPNGVRNLRTRETDAVLARYGHDAPHVALYKMGHDAQLELPLRIHALAAASPFFAPKYAPMQQPRFLAGEPDLGRLTDAASAVVFIASVVESARTGKLDAEWTRILVDAADVFVRLHDKLYVEAEVARHRELMAAE